MHNVLVADSHKFLHCLLQLPYTFCQRAKVRVPQWIMLLCPVLETLGISYCKECWLLLHVLVGEFFQEEGTPIETLGHHSHGGISRCSAWHLPQVFTCYLPLTIAFSHLYRDYTMTEHAFFTGRAEGWGKDMMHLWGSLNICPHLNYLELLHHSSGELLSISGLKIRGDPQEPCNDMAYLLVCTRDTLEAQDYGMSLV